VALVEQRHFASGTSGKNSQLIHGGLRYLKYMQVNLVRESLKERATLRQLAPHLVEPLAFLLPFYSRMDKLKYSMGLSLYDQLAGNSNISRHRDVSKAEILQLEPTLSSKGLVGGAIFYDCRVHSARFVLENLFDAASSGILITNYVKAVPAERLADGTWRLAMKDTLTGATFETKAKKIVDATGAWSHPDEFPLRLVRGSHLVLPRLTAEEHAVSFFDEQGRIVFLIPWGSEKQLTLLGTTDVDHTEGPNSSKISQQEIDYLISIARQLYPNAPSFEPVASFSSLRPLISDKSSSATAASREHKIFNTKDNILRIQGGKYTIYRQMSEEACDQLLKELAPWLSAPSHTAAESLCGNTEKALSRLISDAPRLAEQYHLARIEVERLIREYGVHTPDLLHMVPQSEYGTISRIEYARIAHAVQSEMALKLTDVFYISSYLGFDRSWDAALLEPYAYLMGSWLGWDSARQAQEIDEVLAVTSLPDSAKLPQGSK